MARLDEFARDHELAIVGTVAGVVVALVALGQLTKSSGATSAPAASPTIADLGSAFTAGSAASIAGFQPGVDLASSAFGAATDLASSAFGSAADLASAALGSSSDVASTLAGSQADLAAAVAALAGNQGAGSPTGGGSGAGSGAGSGVGAGAAGSSGSVAQTSGVKLTLGGPVTAYARTNAGLIGAHQTFGTSGLQVTANQLVVPPDPAHGTGGTFWRMTSGPLVGWLVSASNPAVKIG
jgi:hypothetical protein